MTEERDLAYSAMGYALRLNLSVDQIKWELAAARQKLLDALESATPRGLDASLYGASDLVSSHEQEHSGWIKRWRARAEVKQCALCLMYPAASPIARCHSEEKFIAAQLGNPLVAQRRF